MTNRFPTLVPGGAGGGSGGRRAGGYNEVVIESPRHDAGLETLPPDGRRAVVGTWRDRFAALEDRPGVRCTLLARNEGPAAGGSLRHPHSQIFAMQFVPPAIALQLERAAAHERRTGRRLLDDIVEAEIADGRRLLHADAMFAAFVPYAAETPHEVWLVPRGAARRFAAVTDAEVDALAHLLGDLVGRLKRCLPDPAFNLTIVDAGEGPQVLHPWCLRLLPRTRPPTGFDLEAGIAVASALPEAGAAELRAAAGS